MHGNLHELGEVLGGHHDPALVALSVGIAILASFTALDLAGRVRAAHGWGVRLWTGAAAVAMGGGIWAMHFVAMLAFTLPVPITFDPWLTLFSLVLPIIVTGFGFGLVRRGAGRTRWVVSAGIVVGISIATMHYTGMAAMHSGAVLHYDPVLVAVSLLVAVVAATVALWLSLHETAPAPKLGAAVVMGLAVAGMHYTAMAAATWVLPAGHGRPDGATGLEQASLALGVGSTTALILFLSLLAALFDRRFSALAQREAAVALRESEARAAMLSAERAAAEAALRVGETRLHIALEAAGLGTWEVDFATGQVQWDETMGALLGLPPAARESAARRWQDFVHSEDLSPLRAALRPAMKEGGPFVAEFRVRRQDGVERVMALRAAQLPPTRMVGVCQDVTQARAAQAVLERDRQELERLVEERTAALLQVARQRRRAEEEARQAEKLAALGHLTGAVAHDFNNLLQVVTSGAALLRQPSIAGAKREAILDGMIQAGRSARDLTGRLLAFARRQALHPEVVDVAERLSGMSELLRRTLGSGIEVRTSIEPDLWLAKVDPGQLEVAILNLAVNGRDAMPDGGVVTIEARNATLDKEGERPAGEYVCIVVRDTGQGIPQHLLDRVLEPFFTTKPTGYGTGLGLPQVLGFVRQSGGDLSIRSEVGEGTAVSLVLPRALEEAAAARPVSAAPNSARRGTILVVEDNVEVGTLAVSLLEERGYITRHVRSAEEALSLLRSGMMPDVVFSDVVMPGGVGGMELARIARESWPSLPVLLTTGYSEQLSRTSPPDGVEILPKPYQPEELSAALDRALRRKEPEAA
ncbi:MHYT domain-containing protein [Sabulicella glaciei]|uniref:histidine kinase n=1 Tax=Sabulicella glaciei TaxID=2984948 RepID=A0ABT3NS15_9PROT|nr:MHYT domain-containing protein [Roseococcus sp. MDT2-1-1]MCW8084958.1 ATP-binding protein [Roseococcus sp. MDT2-1-1]